MILFEYIVCSFLLSIFCLISGCLLFRTKINNNLFLICGLIILFTGISTILNFYSNNIISILLKIIITDLLFIVFYFLIYKRKLLEAVIASLITYLTIFLSETVVALVFSFILKLFNCESMALFKNTFFINCLIYGSGLVFMVINKKLLSSFVKNNNIFISILIIITATLLEIRIPLTLWKFDYNFIITMLILIFCCIIGFLLLRQKNIIDTKTAMYHQLVNMSDVTNNLLEDYRMVSHEHKNQLSIIRGMVNSNNIKLIDYIDNLLEKRNVIKYQWAGQLNYLKDYGLRSLINYKLLEISSFDINISLTISKEVSKYKFNLMTIKQIDKLYSIIGVYLDNAIQASMVSNEKEISLDIYMENNDMVIMLANTYLNKIDLNHIDDYGYTTKGKNHGVGLSLVKKIMEEENIFSQTRSLVDKYFVQKLIIKSIDNL